LTAGYCNKGRNFEPYGRELCKTLSRLGRPCSVAVCGLVGKTAKQMVEGLNSTVLSDAVHNNGQGLDRIASQHEIGLAIIMAGTNDLSRGLDPDHILSNLKAIHGACHKRNVPTVAIIPPVKARGLIRTVQQRLAGLMIEWSRQASSSSLLVATFDAEKFAPRKPAGLWDGDEIHMSAEGQRTFGQRLAERLACLPLFAERFGVNVSGDVGPEKKRTLTGFFAAKKVETVSGARKESTGHAVPEPITCVEDVDIDEVEKACREKSGSVPGEACREASKNVKMSISKSCLGLATHADLRSLLQQLARALLQNASTMQMQHQQLMLGLTMSCETTGGDSSGWSGSIDIPSLANQELLGEAIMDSLGKLADRASAGLGLVENSAKQGKWSTIRNLIARLQVKQ